MGETEWTCESTIRLVDEYRQRPELWDSSHEMYRVQTAKYDAWSQMARIFECDIADLRKKLNSVSASYRREKAKIRNGGHSSWFLYNNLSFLPNHLESHRQSTSTSSDAQQSQMEREQTSEDDDDDEDDEDRGEQEVLIKQEPSIETYDMDEDAPRDNRTNDVKQPLKRYRLNRPLVKRKLIKENNSLDSRLLETLRLLRKSDLSRKKDECDSFGEYIAVSLRKHDERTQSMIKQAINNILFEQEMKKYSTGHYTVVLQGVDENPLVLGDQEEK